MVIDLQIFVDGYKNMLETNITWTHKHAVAPHSEEGDEGGNLRAQRLLIACHSFYLLIFVYFCK